MSLNLVLNELDSQYRTALADKVVVILENGLDQAASEVLGQLYDSNVTNELSVSNLFSPFCSIWS
jgi:hypothetical protein